MKIKCKNCTNELDRKCIVKEVTINPGKNRKCSEFALDTAREIVRLKRINSIRDRYDARQAARREFLSRQKVKEESRDEKHPVTGDLSRFKTSTPE